MIKKLLLITILCLAASPNELVQPKVPDPPKDYHFVQYIINKYKVKPNLANEIIHKANELTSDKFPRKTDILAIIAIESEFDVSAQSKSGAVGLTQILYKKSKKDVSTNLTDAVTLLETYKKSLGTDQAAIHAYNVGIGRYKNGIRNSKYYKKFLLAKSEFDKLKAT